MPTNNLPAGFVPDPQPALPPGFVPDAPSKDDETIPESRSFKEHPANLFYRNIRERETPEQIGRRQTAAGKVATGAERFGAIAPLVPLGMEAAAAPLATIGKLATSAAGTALGAGTARWGARELGGGQDVQDLAAAVGGLVGGIAGFREPPKRIGFRGLGFEVPSSLRPEGAAREAQEALGAFMNRGYGKTIDPVVQAVREGRAAKLPTRMPAGKTAPVSMIAGTPTNAPSTFHEPLPPVPTEPAAPPPTLTTAAEARAARARAAGDIRGSVANPSGRLILTPEEAATESRMLDIAKTRARQNGLQYAAGMRPAGGGRVPMTPTGVSITDRGMQLNEPIAKTAARIFGSTGRAAIAEGKTLANEDWQAEQVRYEVNRLKGVLRDPRASAEERSIAQSQLDHYLEPRSTVGAKQVKPIKASRK